MAVGTGEPQTADYGFTHTHLLPRTRKRTDDSLSGESREQALQTFKIRKGMCEYSESEIFQEQYKNILSISKII